MQNLIAALHLHPIIDHFTIALLGVGVLSDLAGTAIKILLPDRMRRLRSWSKRLQTTALQLLVLGAVAATFSRFTGESEATRLWDSLSPSAQAVLWSDDGFASLLSHAVLGNYLMYAFVALAVWRALSSYSRAIRKTHALYLLVAFVAVAALLYQGKTGGELVYDHGVGIVRDASRAASR